MSAPGDSKWCRDKRKLRGLCIGCQQPHLPLQRRCADCAKKHREAQRARQLAKARERANQRINVELRCGSCGATQTEPLHADAIMHKAVARVRCLFCGQKTMAREPRKAG